METPEKQPQGQGKIEFILLVSALVFAILAFIGLISAEWREYVRNWLLTW
jgi:hypothetical protein